MRESLRPGREASVKPPITPGEIDTGCVGTRARLSSGAGIRTVPGIRIRMLGPFEVVSRDGSRLAFPTRKAEALLARLARRPGERLARAHLAGLLWPDRPDEQGRTSLRQALAAIRRVLADAGAGGPTTGGDVVSFPADSVEVDVVALETELSRPSPDPARLAALCRGPLLAGFPPVEDTFDDWVEAERAALARLVLERLRPRLGQAARSGGAGDLAIADAALALDPAFEPAYRARMGILLRSGERAAALRDYERCRTALARDLGVRPGPEIEALRREIAADDAHPATERKPSMPSLAVLPFAILSDDPRQELFARGLYEDVIGALSRFRALRLVAPGSVERASDRGSDAIETSRFVAARYALSTSVRGDGSRIRLSLRLVDTATSRQLWAERLDVDPGGALDAQDRITRSVAAALALQIDASELEAALRRPPEELEAYECWIRGIHWLRRGTTAADVEARRLFQRAVEIAPRFARAYSGLSLSYFNDWSCAAWERWDETERNAYQHALEATRLDDRDHVTHCILGRILLYRREYERGIAHVRRAIALNPNDADVLTNASVAHAYYGEPERALELEREARLIHPFHPDWYFLYFKVSRFFARRPREVLELAKPVADMSVDARAFMAAAQAHLREIDCARENARRFTERFARDIAFGKPFDALDPVRWILHVNPIRREEDRAYLVEGLGRAGLPVPPVEAPLGRDPAGAGAGDELAP